MASIKWVLSINLKQCNAIAMQYIDRMLHQIKAHDKTKICLVAYLYDLKKGKKAKSLNLYYYGTCQTSCILIDRSLH